MVPPAPQIIAQLCRRNTRFGEAAYWFVLEALNRCVRQLQAPRHVKGSELADSVRELAMERYGPLARIVLEYWGIHSTADIGDVVFLLVDHGVLTKQESDRREDFEGLWSFEQVFEAEYPWGS
jgi:uncharacterized repeat protein (TIGR04138 family)